MNLKRIFALLLCGVMTFALSACGGEAAPSDSAAPGSDSSVDASDQSSDKEETKDEDVEEESKPDAPNLVMACPHMGDLSVYDLDSVEPGRTLDDAIVWSTEYGLGADMKYREDTVFGDVIVTTGGARFGGGYGLGIISYPEGKQIWYHKNPGNNPHSVEILPNGDIVVANSTGCTLRYFTTSVLAEGGDEADVKWKDFEFNGAHGVLWDPEYDVLWALGNYELAAYSVRPDSEDKYLSKIGGMGAKLQEGHEWGHDLSADYTDSRYLYLTEGAAVQRFDKENNKLILTFPQYKKLSDKNVKGFSNNLNGNFFVTKVNYGKGTSWEGENYASWCTDRIIYGTWLRDNYVQTAEYISETGAFYKMRAFVGSYQ